MIIKIVCAGNNHFEELYQKDEDELLVGVDGGIENILNLGLKVDLALGDFDSTDIEKVKAACSNVKVFPKEKDFGDLELAIIEVIDLDFEKIIIYNATGNRLDHFYATINVLIKYSDYNIEILDKSNSIKIIKNDTIIEKTKYKYCSLFAVEEDTIISLTNLKYNLTDYLLKRDDNLCLSNEIIEKGLIKVNNRKLIVIETL